MDRKELQGSVQNERLPGRREQLQEVILGEKAGWLLQSYFPLGVAGVYQADDLTSADLVIPD